MTDFEVANQAIARFKPYIKTLVVASDKYIPFPSLPAKKYLHDEVCWQTYSSLRREQNDILCRGELFGRLCHCLIALTKLRTIIITDGWRKRDGCWCQQAGYDGCKRGIDLLPHHDLNRTSSSSDLPKYLWSQEAFAALGGIEPNIWPEVLRAMDFTKNSTVAEICVRFSYKYSIVQGPPLISNAFRLDPGEALTATGVMSNLASLELSLGYGFAPWYYRLGIWVLVDKHLTPVARVVSAAVNLRHLKLIQPNEIDNHHLMDEANDPIANCTAILDYCRVPQLKSLHLEGLWFNESNLVSFLRYSNKLENLCIEEGTLASGSWVSLLQKIKERLRLSSFYLGTIYDVTNVGTKTRNSSTCYDYDGPLQAYFFGEGPNPFSIEALQVAGTTEYSGAG